MVVSFPLFVSWVETSGGARLIGGRGRGRNARPVWQISSGFPSLSTHVLVHPGDDCHGIRRELEQLLDERFAIDHTTLQVDHAPEPGLVRIGATPTTRHEH
jgi:hypothetical protein